MEMPNGMTQKNRTHINFKKLSGLKLQSLYHHSSKFQLLWLFCIKVMHCLKYASNGRIGGKLADIA